MFRWFKRIFSNSSRQKPTAGGTHSRTYNKNKTPAAPKNVDLTVSLVLDISGSMSSSNKIGKAKEASLEMVNSLRDLSVALGLISFGNQVTLEADLTKDLGRIKSAIKHLNTSGGTPFYEALEFSKQEHLDKTKDESVLVVDTDGKPTTSSEQKILDLGYRIKDEGTKIITIGIGEHVNSSFLRKLASTPEDYHFAKAPDDIKEAFVEVTGLLVEKASS